VGLNPKEKQSGTSVRGRSRLSKTGSSFLRKVLYFPAITAKRFNPTLQVFCERLAQASKHAKVIIGVAMRKLLQLIYGVLKSGKPYDPNLALIHG
jgi:transposase